MQTNDTRASEKTNPRAPKPACPPDPTSYHSEVICCLKLRLGLPLPWPDAAPAGPTVDLQARGIGVPLLGSEADIT
jgi:hypothetical protein